MRELDELLLNYLEQRYELAPDTEKAAFCALLELPDPDLVSYLLQQESPVPEVRIVVDYILKRVGR
jgi:succinate dehydrogenase flavin-adding protein (antitoxin of CptAB toxin-antitoxin module)